MEIARYDGEPTLAALVKRFYAITRRTSQTQRDAASALMAANPHLGNLDRLSAGALIVVPDVNGARSKAETDLASIPALAHEQRQREAIAKALRDERRREVSAARRALKFLGSKSVRTLRSKSGDVNAALPEIRAEAQRRLDALVGTKKRTARARTQRPSARSAKA